jgi:predicted transcriptional regulator
MADTPILQTAKIVAAYVGNNTIAVTDLPDLMRTTYTALVDAGTPTPTQAERAAPAVTLKKSVTPDALYCLDCGKAQSMLKRHIATAHSMSVDEYRAKWGLAKDYPMVAPSYAAHRSELAKKIGLGRTRGPKKPKSKAKAADAAEGS